jgi:hypothetical protein
VTIVQENGNFPIEIEYLNFKSSYVNSTMRSVSPFILPGDDPRRFYGVQLFRIYNMDLFEGVEYNITFTTRSLLSNYNPRTVDWPNYIMYMILAMLALMCLLQIASYARYRNATTHAFGLYLLQRCSNVPPVYNIELSPTPEAPQKPSFLEARLRIGESVRHVSFHCLVVSTTSSFKFRFRWQRNLYLLEI